ncbi:protein bima [Cladorrhinum samala]|uniref:Protein bima n=1 Tax=Cladorrhinum samala TaxID=585594 RepID=A0AAV9HF20_9PEZI|nr:protein bima [Cladorrhinum samala]
MAPNSATVATLLRQTVYYHLDNFSPDSALFFAERLNAYDRSSESAYLLALCHFRLGDSRSAYEASKTAGYRGVHLGCAFIFAQACLDLERYKDGVTALEKARALWTAKCSIGKHNSTARAPYPDAAAASCLLGKLYRAYDDKKKAIPCFEEALKANPFMWDAFIALCDMGVNVRIPNIFKHNESFARNFDPEPSTTTQAADTSSAIPEPLQKKAGIQAVSHDGDPFEGHRSTAFQDVSSNNMLFGDNGQNDPFSLSRLAAANARFNSNIGSRHAQDVMETPSGPIAAVEPQISRLGSVQEPPQAPTRRTRAAAPVESNIFEAPPRMGYRLGTKRRERLQQEQPSELSESTIKGPPPAPSAIERKRTASGHPVQPRPANGEEPRRSARLNVLPRATASRATVGTTMGLGTAATREVKKARPPVSRIVRPGSGGTMGRVVSGNRKPMDDQNMDVDQAEAPRVKEPPAIQAPPVKTVVEPEPVKIDEALRYILDLLKKMATGYLLSSQFQGQEAMSVFSTLLRSQQDTPWVLARMGRAQYEQANYGEAEKYFKRLRLIAPTRHEDMEVYSTILWHLRKETDLSFLAHELVDAVWDSPQAWCALGNAFSLACDHEQALRCFKRAIQLHPKFAYAYTLQGHEHVENEEYDKALTAYRQAIAADKRHYNAYYGIGKVFEKLGNYEKALSHYKAALVIHPTHAVLICCVGTVLQRQKNIGQALPYFNKAVELAPKAPEIRHKKARALMATGQLEAARDELMVLRDLAPDKAQVHFLLGKLCKMLDDSKGAVRHFTIALSLDPKASSQIKQEIEGLEGGMADESMLP